ncbi:hypothetical protein SAMN04487852_101295 [Prevotella sp. tf2-5]|nr:hypothetical protein SAMN04487852_101295 [Prevotella sp. tf2-5]
MAIASRMVCEDRAVFLFKKFVVLRKVCTFDL